MKTVYYYEHTDRTIRMEPLPGLDGDGTARFLNQAARITWSNQVAWDWLYRTPADCARAALIFLLTGDVPDDLKASRISVRIADPSAGAEMQHIVRAREAVLGASEMVIIALVDAMRTAADIRDAARASVAAARAKN